MSRHIKVSLVMFSSAVAVHGFTYSDLNSHNGSIDKYGDLLTGKTTEMPLELSSHLDN